MERDLVLNKTNSKFVLKMIGVESFRNPKNQSQEQSEGKKQKEKKKLEPKLKVFQENQVLDNTCM